MFICSLIFIVVYCIVYTQWTSLREHRFDLHLAFVPMIPASMSIVYTWWYWYRSDLPFNVLLLATELMIGAFVIALVNNLWVHRFDAPTTTS